MTTQPDTAQPANCEHYFASHILGGQPMHVRLCQLCRAVDWADLAEQAAEVRAAALEEAADFMRDAHFRDGLSVQEIATALSHMADRARTAAARPDKPDVRQMLVHPVVWPHLEAWLATRGIALHRVSPAGDDLATYAMTPTDAVMAAATRPDFQDRGEAARQAAEKPRPGGAWTEADRIVAYRSRGGRLLRCLEHHPGEDSVECGDFIPVAAEDLEDGGLCTYPGCGADVLIPARPDDTTPRAARMACAVCDTPVGWIDCPTGGWWAHADHPQDGHDAQPRPDDTQGDRSCR